MTEEEITSIYDELLRLPKEKWEAKITQIDGIIEEKKRILNKINQLLIGYRLNRSKLEDIKKNIHNVIDKDEVKRFVEKYLNFNGGKLETINMEEEVFRIFLPKQIAIPVTGGTRIIEGCFNSDIAIKKGYTYFALGNPYIMGLVHDAAKPSVAVLTHPSNKGMLVSYKVAIKDGKGRERSAKVFVFNFNDQNSERIKEIDAKNVWDYGPSSNTAIACNKLEITKHKEEVDLYADKYVNNLLTETATRLAEIRYKTEESIPKYYSRQIEEINSKIEQYIEKLSESPNYYRLIEKERTQTSKLQNELRTKLYETKRDFDLTPEIELVGIAMISALTGSDIKRHLEQPGMIPHYSDFSRLTQQFNTENSQTTHSRLQRNPEEWVGYHKLYREARKGWKIIPYEEMIKRIEQLSPRLKVGDFGCGEAKIMESLGYDRIYSCDHVAINEKVTACDMKSVPLPDGSLDMVVFSLSLMGKNWIDYIH